MNASEWLNKTFSVTIHGSKTEVGRMSIICREWLPLDASENFCPILGGSNDCHQFWSPNRAYDSGQFWFRDWFLDFTYTMYTVEQDPRQCSESSASEVRFSGRNHRMKSAFWSPDLQGNICLGSNHFLHRLVLLVYWIITMYLNIKSDFRFWNVTVMKSNRDGKVCEERESFLLS